MAGLDERTSPPHSSLQAGASHSRFERVDDFHIARIFEIRGAFINHDRRLPPIFVAFPFRDDQTVHLCAYKKFEMGELRSVV